MKNFLMLIISIKIALSNLRINFKIKKICIKIFLIQIFDNK